MAPSPAKIVISAVLATPLTTRNPRASDIPALSAPRFSLIAGTSYATWRSRGRAVLQRSRAIQQALDLPAGESAGRRCPQHSPIHAETLAAVRDQRRSKWHLSSGMARPLGNARNGLAAAARQTSRADPGWPLSGRHHQASDRRRAERASAPRPRFSSPTLPPTWKLPCLRADDGAAIRMPRSRERSEDQVLLLHLP